MERHLSTISARRRCNSEKILSEGKNISAASAGLTSDNIFISYRFSMFERILPKLLQRGFLFNLVGGLLKFLISLKRELTIHHDRPGRVRKVNETVSSFAIGKCVLKQIGAFRQTINHNIGQLRFAKRAACLLVI